MKTLHPGPEARTSSATSSKKAALAMSDTILVVDPESEAMGTVVEHLRSAGFTVVTSQDGEDALSKARRLMPALVITEVELAGLSGLELCQAVRNDPLTEEMHLIMLTRRDSDVDRVVGFELGADDYVTKPFNPRELVLRVKAVMRRSMGWKERRLVKAGPITIDHSRCCVLLNGGSITLTPLEFKLLATLAARPGMVQTRDTLLCEVWGDEFAIESRSVDTYLRRLRMKLGAAGSLIETVHGFGYRLAC